MQPMVDLFIKAFAPRNFWHGCFTYAVFIVLFNLLFLALGGILEMRGDASVPDWVLFGTLQCTPFLLIALFMLRQLLVTQQKMARLAATDQLTGLPNRRAFLDQFTALLEETAPRATLLMIDADHFKAINDAYGHAVGDICLKEFALLLKKVCGPKDFVARLGGEEFGVLLSEPEEDRIKQVSHDLATGISLYPPEVPNPIHLTNSIGAVEVVRNDTISGLMRKADQALYRAKDAGRARMVLFAGHEISQPQLKQAFH